MCSNLEDEEQLGNAMTIVLPGVCVRIQQIMLINFEEGRLVEYR